MSVQRHRFASLQDIRDVESQPYDIAVPLVSTYDILLTGAREYAGKPAIVQLASGNVEEVPRIVSYEELLVGVQRAANLFRSLGVGAEDAVALLLPSMIETHYALWGAELAGRACPINFMLSVDHIAELVRAAGAKVVVALGADADFDIFEKAEELRKIMPELQVLQVGAPNVEDSFERQLMAHPAELTFERNLSRDTIAAYYHTGGTTGAPKLAMHTHGNEVHTSWFAGMYYGLERGDVMVNGFPLFHVAGAFVYGAACFCAGATLLLPPRLGMRHKGFVANYWRFVERFEVSYLATVPTVIAALLDVAPTNARLNRVKALYTGGSPLPTELANAFEKRYGIPVRNILGMTESAGLVSIEPLHAPRVPLSCGWPLPYTEAYAAPLGPSGPDLERQCKPGDPGVIVLRGPHVGPGYTDPARNAGMYDSGFLISGDLGHTDAKGRIYITGRAKDVIIRGAHNIDPSMIEEAFAAHPAVQSCAAVGEPDAYAGELPTVFLTLRSGATASADEILAFAAQRIPERAALPKRVTLLETMPMTAIGKIYKPSLRLRAVEQAYVDALRPFKNTGTIVTVRAREVPGGMRVDVVLSGGRDSVSVETQVAETLQRFTVPFQLTWR